MAYRARNRDDLLAGIDDFLDHVTVLPPGEWDPKTRIEPPKSVPTKVRDKRRDNGYERVLFQCRKIDLIERRSMV